MPLIRPPCSGLQTCPHQGENVERLAGELLILHWIEQLNEVNRGVEQ
jgi:hypothetical protein